MGITQSSDQPGELRQYIEVLWERKLTIFIMAGVLAGAALLGSLLKTDTGVVRGATASSTAEIVVRPMPGGLDGQTLAPNLETEKQILGSLATAEPATDRLGTKSSVETILSGLTVEVLPESEVLRVEFSSQDADEVEEVLSAVVDQYVTARNKQAAAILSGFEEILEARRASLGSSLDRLDRRRSRAAAEGNKAEARILQSQRAALFLRLDSIDEQLARVQSRRYEEFGAALLKPPTTPSYTPGAASTSRGLSSSIALGFALGLLLGAAVALLQAFVDRRLYTRDEVESSLGLPVLGVVPAAEEKGREWEVSIKKLTAAVVNSLGAVGTPVLVLTSTVPGAGTTTVATHVAQTLSRSKPTTFVITGSSALAEGNDSSALDVVNIPAGACEDAQSATAFLGGLKAGERWVVIDAPPTTIEGDAVVLGSAADAILMVLRTGAVTEHDALEAIAEMRAAGGHIAGVVLTFGPKISRRL